MTLRRRLVLALVLVLATTTSAAAGVTIVRTDRSTGPGAGTTTMKIRLADTAARIDTDKNALIYRKDLNTAWMIQGDSYMELDKASARAVGKQVDAQMAQAQDKMKEALDKVPPGQRAAMEALIQSQGMGQGAAAGGGVPAAAKRRPPTFKPGAKGKAVGKWSCDEYDGSLDGALVERVCAAELEALGLTRADVQIMYDAAKFFKEVSAEFGSASQYAVTMGVDENPGYPGYPISRKEYRGGSVTLDSEIKEITREDYEASLFERPNLKKREFGPGAP
jgi:hypothetical protein